MSKLTFCLILLAILAAAIGQELYSDQFDHINVDDILPNDDLRNQYYKCIMDTGPCVTDDQKYFREHAAEAFATKCQKCTDKQKQNLDKIVAWYTENRPDEWNAMLIKLMEDVKKLNITPVL